jgi:3',5'-cyclic AMP phosphodiesterase CpdA
MKLIQVSDLHFIPPGQRLFGLDPRARLEAAIADINENHGDAEICLFTGDLADGGAPESYESLRQALTALRIPCRLLIGNHDDRDNFLRAFPEAPRDEGGFVQSVVSNAACDLILLDTHEPGIHAGRLCAARQAWLRARLNEAAGRPVYLFMHHPPFDVGIPCMDRIGLLDKEGFAAALDGAANIQHLFFGHLHRPISGSWRGIPYSCLRSLVHQVPLDFVTVEPVPYDLAPPAYNVILIGDGVTVVHHHEFLDDSRLPPGQARYTKAE